MKIAVCVKHVPEGPSRLDPQTLRLDRSHSKVDGCRSFDGS